MGNKKGQAIRLLALLLSLISSLGWAVKLPGHLSISGLSGDVLKNVESRLAEVYSETTPEMRTDHFYKLQVQKAIEPYGYFKSLITVSHKGKHNIHLSILPGPRMHVRRFEIKLEGLGAKNPELIKTSQTLPLRQGAPFDSTNYEETKQALFNAAENEGFLRASFTTAEIFIDLDANAADVILIFNTGPQYYFGHVKYDTTLIVPELLARYIPFERGGKYSTEQVLALNSQLSASGYFRDVTITPEIANEREVPIDVHLQPVSRFNYSLGAGYGTDTGIRGRAGLQVVPVNRYGHKLTAVAQGSFNENIIQTQYIIPGRNPVTDQYNLNASFSNLNYNAGLSNALLLSAAQRKMRNDFRRTLSVNALFENYYYTDQPKLKEEIVFPKAIFNFRNVEDDLFSPSGYNVAFTGLGALKPILSDISFLQGSIDAKAALTIEPISTRIYFHGIQGGTSIQNIDTLPLSIAQLLGGTENQKAYTFNSIGPGKILTFGGVEIQKELYKKWYAVGFYDLGNVSNPSPINYVYDAGGGIMWVSPVGPIKVAFAQAITSQFQRLPDRRPKLIISMGPDL
jgi:translocation and assembly module TamA